ncbi:phytanoyl- dioxygenase protein [Rutstroemia sp. NJR-2017a BVV2]|nr:phytanoyl- dioxygenase protein [Rutstroemia sp. NJR-2017a BVV2]
MFMPSTTTSSGLTPDQLSTFNRDGYLIIPGALAKEKVAELLKETRDMLEGFSLEDHPMTRFTTGEEGGKDGGAHVGDRYFLESGDKVRFFFEEDALSPTGELLKPKNLSINKIGHSLHTLSPPFASISHPSSSSSPTAHSPSAIARALGFQFPQILQSMIICKNPEIGGAVPPHQDSTFLYTDPPSAVGFWYALEDATRENGCLSFWPGSHRWSAVERRFVRRRDGAGTEFVGNEGERWPRGLERGEGDGEGKDEEDKYELGEVKAGDLVLIHGNLLHKSERNTSSKGRIIYTFHVIEGAEGWVYDERNWLQPPAGGFTKL